MRIWCQLPVDLPGKDAATSPYLKSFYAHFDLVKRPDTEVLIRGVAGARWDPPWETFAGLRAFNSIEILKSVLQAEKEGCDGVSISCFLDPLIFEARQLLKIPVTALSEAAMHFACVMGSRFAIITKDEHYLVPMAEQISRYGLENKAIKRNPVRMLAIDKAKLSKIEQGIFTGAKQDYTPLLEAFREVGRECIADGAEVLIMGCGLLSPVLLRAGLTEVDGAALVEPNHAALKLTEALVDLYKAGLPFVSRRSTFLDVPSSYIKDVLASRR